MNRISEMEVTWMVIRREGKGGRIGEMVQGIRCINSKYKIGRARLRIV